MEHRVGSVCFLHLGFGSTAFLCPIYTAWQHSKGRNTLLLFKGVFFCLIQCFWNGVALNIHRHRLQCESLIFKGERVLLFLALMAWKAQGRALG